MAINIIGAIIPGLIGGTIIFLIKWKQLGYLPPQDTAQKIFIGSMEFTFALFLLWVAVYEKDKLCGEPHLPEILFMGSVLTIIHSFYKVAPNVIKDFSMIKT
jgi:hypothetical protein